MESLLTARDVARLAGVSRSLIYRSARRGSLVSIRIGRLRRFRADDVELWLAQTERRCARRLRHFRAADIDAYLARTHRPTATGHANRDSVGCRAAQPAPSDTPT